MAQFKKTKFLSLDDRIEKSKFDFCKNLKWFIIAPIVIVLIGLILLCTVGFNLGIDFTGGSNMTIYIDSEGTVGQPFNINNDLGAIESKINNVLKEYGYSVSSIQKTTMSDEKLHITNGNAVIIKYQNNTSNDDNEEIKLKLLKSFGYVEENITLEQLANMDEEGYVSNGGITTASASSELMMNSFIALLVAVAVILIYIAFRFELTGGLAAILALFHDLLITSSIILICRIEINVSFIAALITILGYSINNTIIIFDRMRDELKTQKNSNNKIDNNEIANLSVKQTMTRSILTMITTFVMIFIITIIGVPDIREFAFPIMIGILSGFYSSVFITPALWAIAYRPRKKKNNISKKKNQKVVEKTEQIDNEVEITNA